MTEAHTPAGAAGPVGSGIEGADDALEADRGHDREEIPAGFDTVPGTQVPDDETAAEQGNREGDEMVSEGDDVQAFDDAADADAAPGGDGSVELA